MSEDLVYLNGRPVENPHEDNHHVSPLSTYYAVFGGLMVLTVITYLVSFAGLGAASLPVAMLVASMKAALVLAFFMHLKDEDRFYTFLFACSVLFISLFFGVTLLDIKSSGDINDIQNIKYKRNVEDRAEQILEDM